MTTGKVKARARTRPADSAKEAYGRWGLTRDARDGPSRLLRGGRKRVPAYTAEDHERDIKDGVALLPRLAYSCPRDRPERNCRGPFEVPASYLVQWHQRLVHEPRKPTAKHPNPLPRRETTLSKFICFDCYLWLFQVDRWRFAAEHGQYELETASLECAVVKDTNKLADIAAVVAHQVEMFDREARELDELTGGLDDEVIPFTRVHVAEDGSMKSERYEQANLLAKVRHCLAAYARVTGLL
jgi:hypothetical protein